MGDKDMNVQVILEIFHLIETRDPCNQPTTQRGRSCYNQTFQSEGRAT
jgi:hypothetical protein